jgi:DNA polymerase-3 subunit alpha
MTDGFVHLRVRSAYSLLEGAVKPKELGGLAAGEKMPAVGVADRANLFGALEISQLTKDKGVQPVVGCALPVSGIGKGPTESWARKPTSGAAGAERDRLEAPLELSTKAYLDSDGDPACAGRRWRRAAKA